jgi:Tfp pilus assembly protein PilP
MGLVACSSDLDLESRMNTIEKKVEANGQKIQNEPQVKEVDFLSKTDQEMFYNPNGRRDPYKSFEGKVVTKTVRNFENNLELFDLSELTLTAVVWGIAKPKALFRAPDGYSYIAQKGNRIGRNGGKIVKVARNKVYVQEEYRSPTGDITVRQLELDLHLEQEDDEDQELESLEFSFSDE